MTPLILLVLGLLGGEEAHASLHPADAVLYVEVPDVAAALAALDDLPLVKLLQDPELGEIVQGLAEPGFDLEDRTLGAYRRLLAGPRQILDGMGTLSVSLTAPHGMERFLNPAGFDADSAGVRLVADFRDEALARFVLERVSALATEVRRGEDEALQLYLPPLGGNAVRVHLDGKRLLAEIGSVGSGEKGMLGDTELSQHGAMLPRREGTVFVEVVRRAPVFDLMEAGLRVAGVDPTPYLKTMPRGMDPFDRAEVSRTTISGGRIQTDTFVPADAVGIPIQPRFLDPGAFSDLPTDAMFAYVGTFEGKPVLGALRQYLASGRLSTMLTQLRSAGIDLDTLAASIGPGVSIHAAGPSGLGLPPTFVWCDLHDAGAFSQALDGFVKLVPQLLPGVTAGTREQKIKKAQGEYVSVPLTTFDLTAQLGPLQQSPIPIGSILSPTIAVLPGRVLLGLSTAAVKKELKRVLALEGDMGALVERVGAPLAKETVSFSTMDWAMLAGGVYDLARSLGPMLAGMAGEKLPFDAASLPPSSHFTEGFRPSFHLLRKVDGGWLRQSESSFGPEVALVPLAAYLESSGALARKVTAMPGPASGGEPVTGELGTTLERLRSVRESVEAYHREVGRFPRELFDLSKPTPRYLGGFLSLGGEAVDGNGVPLDGWGKPLVYERSEDGAEFRLRSVGPDGVDDGGGGDDVTSS